MRCFLYYDWLESKESNFYIVIMKFNTCVAATQLQRLVIVRINGANLYFVTVTSHERHGVSDHRKLDHLFNSLLRLTKKENFKYLHYWTIVCEGDPTVTRASPYKGPVMRKPLPSRDVTILLLTSNELGFNTFKAKVPHSVKRVLCWFVLYAWLSTRHKGPG